MAFFACVCTWMHVCARPHNGGVNEGMPQQPDKRRNKGASLSWMGHAIVSPSLSSSRNLIFPSFPQRAAQLGRRANVKNKFQRAGKPVICRNIRALFLTEAVFFGDRIRLMLI